jgi:hypothetical protein
VKRLTFSDSPEIDVFLLLSLLASFAFLHLLVLLQSVSFLIGLLFVFLIEVRSTGNEVVHHKISGSFQP